MSIPTLRTFTSDTYLSGTDMAWNFETIKTAINGGIAAADVSATAGFAPSQVAQNNSIQFVSVSNYTAGASTTSRYVYFPVDCDIYDLSVIAKKADTADASAEGSIQLFSATALYSIRATFNEDTGELGYRLVQPRVSIQAGFYYVSVSKSSNVELATLRIGTVVKHTKR